VDSSLVIVGLNSQTAPASARERFWMDEIARTEAVNRLARAEGICEALVLVTHARTEFIVWADDPSEAATSILQLLSQRFGLKLCEWKHFYRMTDKAAIAHVLSLLSAEAARDEADIAELRTAMTEAWHQAQAGGTCGRMLDVLLTRAFVVSEATKPESLRTGHTAADMIAAEAKSLQKKLMAERVAPAAAIVRVRVEDICRQEIDAFERAMGPVNEPQKNAFAELKLRVTKRIAGEVEHELKQLKQTAAQQNLGEAAKRLLDHGEMRDLVHRSHN